LKQRWPCVESTDGARQVVASQHICCCCCGHGWQSRFKLRCTNVVFQR